MNIYIIYIYIYVYIYIFLSQNFIKIKHNREMVGKTCPNMKLTPI